MRDAALPTKKFLHIIICTYLGNEVEFRQKQGSFKRMFDFHGKGRVLTREVQTDDGRVYTDVSMAELFKLKPKNRLMSRKTIYKTAPYQAIVKLVINKEKEKLVKTKTKLWEVQSDDSVQFDHEIIEGLCTMVKTKMICPVKQVYGEELSKDNIKILQGLDLIDRR